MAEVCDILQNKMVPLTRVVQAAIIDVYEDIGKVQQRYSHWAVRGLKRLNRQTLKMGKRYVVLPVNRSTNTATLPDGFYEEIFVGLMTDQGTKIPLKVRPELVNSRFIDEIPCEDKCPKCDQNKAICNDLSVSESTTLVVIEGNTYEQTVVKKMYPNGDYYLESRIPMWDIDSETVVYTTEKKFVTSIDLKPCGCIEETEENIEKIKCVCYDVYCSYFTSCDQCCDVNHGGYRIFEETGLIQFDNIGKFTKCYIEYWDFMLKKNGQYQVPEVAFECLVEWIKFKAVDGKKSETIANKQLRWERYRTERSNMNKELGRISISQVIQAIGLTPKFDYELLPCPGIVKNPAPPVVAESTADDSCASTTPNCPPNGGVTSTFIPFSISGIAGSGGAEDPTPGVNTFQSDKLKGALGVNFIVVNNNNETYKAGQFTLDTTTGILTRIGNIWQEGDTFVIPTFYKLV